SREFTGLFWFSAKSSIGRNGQVNDERHANLSEHYRVSSKRLKVLADCLQQQLRLVSLTIGGHVLELAKSTDARALKIDSSQSSLPSTERPITDCSTKMRGLVIASLMLQSLSFRWRWTVRDCALHCLLGHFLRFPSKLDRCCRGDLPLTPLGPQSPAARPSNH